MESHFATSSIPSDGICLSILCIVLAADICTFSVSFHMLGEQFPQTSTVYITAGIIVLKYFFFL